jgi:hypothetical protein
MSNEAVQLNQMRRWLTWKLQQPADVPALEGASDATSAAVAVEKKAE